MGVLLETPPSMHAYRSMRRRFATQRREGVLSEVKLKLAEKEKELQEWNTWWVNWTYFDSDWSSEQNLATSQNLAEPITAVGCSGEVPIVSMEAGTFGSGRASSPTKKKKAVTFNDGGQIAENVLVEPVAPVLDEVGSGAHLGCSKCEGHIVMTEEQLQHLMDELAEKLEHGFEQRFEKVFVQLKVALEEAKDLRIALAAAREKLDETKCRLHELEQEDLYDDHHEYADTGSTDADCVGSPLSAVREGDRGLHKNDLLLPVDLDGTVQWERCRELDHALREFLNEAQREGWLRCGTCGKDTTRLPGNYGHVYSRDGDTGWEEKHIIDLLGDWPAEVRCLRCHFGTVRCKFYDNGFCARGGSCAFQHEQPTQSNLCVDHHHLSSEASTTKWQCYLDAADVCSLCAVSRSAKEFAKSVRY